MSFDELVEYNIQNGTPLVIFNNSACKSKSDCIIVKYDWEDLRTFVTKSGRRYSFTSYTVNSTTNEYKFTGLMELTKMTEKHNSDDIIHATFMSAFPKITDFDAPGLLLTSRIFGFLLFLQDTNPEKFKLAIAFLDVHPVITFVLIFEPFMDSKHRFFEKEICDWICSAPKSERLPYIRMTAKDVDEYLDIGCGYQIPPYHNYVDFSDIFKQYSINTLYGKKKIIADIVKFVAYMMYSKTAVNLKSAVEIASTDTDIPFRVNPWYQSLISSDSLMGTSFAKTSAQKQTLANSYVPTYNGHFSKTHFSAGHIYSRMPQILKSKIK
jgi:hypothetical protein